MARSRLAELRGGPWDGELRSVNATMSKAGLLRLQSRKRGEAIYVATGQKSTQNPGAEVYMHRPPKEKRAPHG